MKRLLTAAACLAFTVALAPWAGAADEKRVFTMNPQNGSGQSGTVTLSPLFDTQTRVTIAVANEANGDRELAHFHTGPCATLGKVVYPLNKVIRGKSTTVLKVPISTLTSSGFAVNVHQDGKPSVYVSCADIK